VNSLDPYTSAKGLAQYSLEFLTAATEALRTKPVLAGMVRIGVSVAITYLLGHALELSLKAFLLHRRVPVGELSDRRALGHDLSKCLARARKLGFDRMIGAPSAQELAELQYLNELYCHKELEYALGGERRLPAHFMIEAMTQRIVFDVARLVGKPIVAPNLP
jgi:hypothetical protein